MLYLKINQRIFKTSNAYSKIHNIRKSFNFFRKKIIYLFIVKIYNIVQI